MPWYLAGLAVVAAGLIALAVLEIGPPTSSARTSREVLTAEDGVVQSTVTGTGNVEASGQTCMVDVYQRANRARAAGICTTMQVDGPLRA